MHAADGRVGKAKQEVSCFDKRDSCLESCVSDEEKYGYRDLTYSKWHRPKSGWLKHDITYIDLDACEYCHSCYEPLALIETAMDVDQSEKSVIVTRRLAEKANLPAYLVFYRISAPGNIDRFRVRQIFPRSDKEIELMMTPQEYALFLTSIHDTHQCHKQYRDGIVARARARGKDID